VLRSSVSLGPRVRGVGDVEIATYHFGGDGPPVLLLHATGFHGRCWLPLAPALTGSFSVWAMDHRGHGSSGKAARYDDWSVMRDDTLAVVDALGGPPFLAAGHSMGGAVAILAEQRRPGTFPRIYCYEPIVFPPMPPRKGRDLSTAARKRRSHFPSREAARSNYAGKLPFSRFAPDALDAYVNYGFVDLPDGTVTLACARDDEASVYEGSLRHDGFQRLPEVQSPVTVARGGHDSDMGLEVQTAVSGRLPHPRTETFESLSHFGPMEDPLLVGGAIAGAFA